MTENIKGMTSSIIVGVRQQVVAFAPPLRERGALRAVKRAAAAYTDSGASDDADCVVGGSVAIADWEIFRFVSFLLSAEGSAAYPGESRQLLTLLVARCTKKTVKLPGMEESKTFTHWEDSAARYSLAETDRDNVRAVVLVTYRPKLLLPLYMASARSAVKFVNAVVALVTANAYISTLGGGHFCVAT